MPISSEARLQLTSTDSFSFPHADGIVPESVSLALWQRMSASQKAMVGPAQQSMRRLFIDQASAVPETQKPLLSSTGGAPGSGKSRFQQHFRNGAYDTTLGSDSRRQNAVFADPDRGVLVNMPQYSALPPRSVPDYSKQAIDLYNHVKDVTVSVTNLVLNEAVNTRKNIVFGTTLTTPAAAKVLQAYAGRGYDREMQIMSAPEEFREAAQRCREETEGLYQVTGEDYYQKGLMATERTADWLTHGGDTIALVWNDDLSKEARVAAVFKPSGVEICDRDAYKDHVRDYTKRHADLPKPETVKTWAECLAINSAWKNDDASDWENIAP